MLRRPALLLCGLASLLLAGRASAQLGDSLIAATDLVKIKQLDSPALSPDGKHVVYVVKSIEEIAGKPGEYAYHTQLWLVAIDGKSGTRQLTRSDRGVAEPTWSPHGDRIAFVRTIKDKPQIWILPLTPGGEAFPLTHVPQGASHPRWSPDGTQLLFTSPRTLAEAREELERSPAKPKITWPSERPGRQFLDTNNWAEKESRPTGADDPAGDAKASAAPAPAPAAKLPPPAAPDPDGTLQQQREWLARNEAGGDPHVTTRLDFLGESDLEPNEQFNHFFVIGLTDDATPQSLTPGFGDFSDPIWVNAPEGAKIVCSGKIPEKESLDRITERDLWVLSLDGLAPKRLLHTDHSSYFSPVPSPDGKTLAFLAEDLSKKSYGQTTVDTLPLAGGTAKVLTEKLDRNAAAPKWSPDGKFIYFVAPTNGGYPLYRVPAGGGNTERLTDTGSGIRGYDMAAQDGVAVVVKPSDPYELYRFNTLGKEPRLLTVHNGEWLREKTLSTPEHRELSRPDGTKLDVWLMKPAFFEGGRKYPLLVEIHGGPQAMFGPGDPTTWHEFQFFAARGYGIVYCNPRGSGGYGYAFQHANFQNWAPGPADDVLAAVDLATKENWVDPDREVIAGGSYGGFLTTWIVAHDHRFKAAIAQRGVYDLATFFGEGNAWRLVPYQFGGYPWEPEIRKLLDEQSPLAHVADITTPLMIKVGEADRRVGLSQSEMLYRSLKVLGKPVEYVRYPRATHELSRSGEPKQRVDRLVRFDEFFQRFLQPVSATTTK